ncbi:MAG: hypothetical protein ACXV3C_10045 [Actinomycetes bacterium]
MRETTVDAPEAGWRRSADDAARRLAAITGVGVLLGLLVGGVGGRLAMMLLSRLNPQATGFTSDDGFRIGQFTVPDTLNLLVVGAMFGLIGAGFYALVRGLMLGPRWFQVLCIAGGPAVVVGAAIVHTDGIDFQLLEPSWLAIGLFVAIPALYAGLLTVLAERVLRDGSWAMRAPLRLAVAPLVLWAPLAPALAVLVGMWALREWLRRSPRFASTLDHPALPWTGRLGLVGVFTVSLIDLSQDATALL